MIEQRIDNKQEDSSYNMQPVLDVPSSIEVPSSVANSDLKILPFKFGGPW